MVGFLNYVSSHAPEISKYLFEHVQLTLLSVVISIAIGVPIGILISYITKLTKPVLGFANVVQAIPSLALLGFLIPVLGIGSVPAVVVVVIYSLLPIIKNTATGLNNISSEMIEAANGIGMTPFQVLYKIKLPLALPVIMAGVRISAVTAVGLITIAALIGAGGLGYLVYAGIRTINNYQILSGAIPACIVALLVDAFAGLIEKAVTPVSFRKDVQSFNTQKIKENKRNRKIIISATAIFLSAFLIVSVVTRQKPVEKSISIGSKDFTEQELIATIYADLIERKTDIKVERNFSLGGTQVLLEAMKIKDVDMYIEYTGTLYSSVFKQTQTRTPEEIYDYVAKAAADEYDFTVMQPTGFNNTYCLVVDPDFAQRHNLKTISDLKKVSRDCKFGVTIEFMSRPDGWPGLEKAYDLEFADVLAVDSAPRYTAMQNNQIQVLDAFSTDGMLDKFGFVTLEDNLSFFPPYYAVPFLRQDILDEYPELGEVINLLTGFIDDITMRNLNYQVDVLERDISEVSKEFIETSGILDK